MWGLIAIVAGLVLVTRGGPRRRAVHEDRRGDRAERRGHPVKATAKHAHADLLRERYAEREEGRGTRMSAREERKAAGTEERADRRYDRYHNDNGELTRSGRRAAERSYRRTTREMHRLPAEPEDSGFVYLGTLDQHFQDPELNRRAESLLDGARRGGSALGELFDAFLDQINEVFHDGLDQFDPVKVVEPSPFGIPSLKEAQQLYDDLLRFETTLSKALNNRVVFSWPSKDLGWAQNIQMATAF